MCRSRAGNSTEQKPGASLSRTDSEGRTESMMWTSDCADRTFAKWLSDFLAADGRSDLRQKLGRSAA